MNILHIAGVNPKKLTGVGGVVYNLIEHQKNLGHHAMFYNQRDFSLSHNDGIRQNITLKRIIIDFNPDIVVFHNLYSLRYVLYSILLKIKGIPYIVFPHGGATNLNHKKNESKKKIADFLFFNRFLKWAAGITFLNEAEQNLDYYKSIPTKRFVIPNGVKIPLNINTNLDDEKISLVFLSRIDINHKGLDLLISALEIIKDELIRNAVEFNFYGFGKQSEIESFTRMLANLNLDNFQFKGAIFTEEEKAKVLNSTDIFVLTSRYEGMPLSVLEALSYGVPCFLSEATNMGDVINNHKSGWITNGEPEFIGNNLISAIKEYKSNKQLYRENARNTALKFQWQDIAIQTIEAYTSVLKEKNH